MNMKTNTVNLRVSEADEVNLKQAAENLSILTDQKPSLSKAIRAGVKILAEQDPNKPELCSINRKALRDLDANVEYGKEHLQPIIDNYPEAVGSLPTIEEIAGWFGKYRSNYLVPNNELIRESIVQKLYLQQRAMYPGLRFSIENIDLKSLGVNIDPLIEICGQLIFIPSVEMRDVMYWRCFEIRDNRVEILPEAVETVKNQWRVYAVTSEEKNRLSVIKKLCTVMDSIKLTNPAQMNIPGIVVYDDEAGVYIAAEHFVKGYIK